MSTFTIIVLTVGVAAVGAVTLLIVGWFCVDSARRADAHAAQELSHFDVDSSVDVYADPPYVNGGRKDGTT